MSREISKIVFGVILVLMVGFSVSILQGYWSLEYLRSEFLVSEINRSRLQKHFPLTSLRS